MDRKKNDIAFAFSSGVAIIVNIIFWLVGTQESVQRLIAEKFGQVNLIIFFLSILLYSAVFIIVYNILNRKEDRQLLKASSNHFMISFICVVIINAVFLLVQFLNANQVMASVSDDYIWHKIPIALLVFILISLFAAFLSITNRLNAFSLENTTISNKVFWAIGICIALVASYGEYFPNVSTYHMDAYYTSIYNVSHGATYSNLFGSIYGHYAILYAPILSLSRIFGATNMLGVFALCMAVITFTEYVLVTYTISVFVKNKTIRVLGVCAMAFTSIAMRGEDIYFQVHPHRTLVIAVTMALIACAVKHPKKMKLITGVGFALCGLMIIWSTEMGLTATLTWMVFLISRDLQAIKLKSLRLWRKIGLYTLFGVLSFLTAWGATNLYNILNNGDALSFNGFMYPYLSEVEFVNIFSEPLNNMTTSWIFVVFLFLFYLGKGISSTKLCNRNAEMSRELPGILAVSVFGLISIIYFINRPVYYNLDIILALAVMLLCIMAQDALPCIKTVLNRKDSLNHSIRHGIAAGFGITAAFTLFALSLGTFVNLGNNLDSKDDFKKEASLTEIAEQISQNVPPDTKAWGMYIPEVYSILDWDMQLYIADFEDILFYPDIHSYLDKELNSLDQEALLISKADMAYGPMPKAYNDLFKSHYIANTIWNYNRTVAFQYFLPMNKDRIIKSFPDFIFAAGNDYSINSQEIEIERNTEYYISFQAITKEAPTTFYVDFCGEGYDLDTSQVALNISPELLYYSAKISSGDVELPKDVFIRTVAQSQSNIEIKNFKIYKEK